MKAITYLTLIIFILLIGTTYQQGKSPKRKMDTIPSTPDGLVMNIINTILGGPHDAPILTRIMNKITHIIGILATGLIAYFKFFWQKKKRAEKISQFIGDEKISFATDAQKQLSIIGENEVDRIIFHLNAPDVQRTMAINSNNNNKHFITEISNIDVNLQSVLIYNISMDGKDPEGVSSFTGFVTFKDKRMVMRLEKTYKNMNKDKELPPICCFAGMQKQPSQQLIVGEWWIENQKGTNGDYAGKWSMTL